MKHFLDSKGICFLCLKCKNLGDEVESCDKQFSLRAISRYLNFDIWNFFRELNPSSESKETLEDECEVFVSLCDMCSDMMETCTELYNILEETKLLLNGCLHKILGVMDMGRNDVLRREEMRRLLQSQDQDGVGHRELGTLREKIMLRCDRKLKMQAPLVKLRRLPEVHLKTDMLPEIPSPLQKIVLKFEAEEFIKDVKMSMSSRSPAYPFEEEDEASNLVVTNSFSCAPSLDSPSSSPIPPDCESFDNDDDPFIDKLKSRPLTCQYCKKQFSSPWKKSQLHHHLRVLHPEHFFPKVRKLSNLPPNKFKRVVYILQGKFIKDGNCSLCSKKYLIQSLNARTQYVRDHLLLKHRKILEEELMKQENLASKVDKDDDNDDDSLDIDKPPPRSLTCQYCKKQFSQSTKLHLLNIHLRINHPEHCFPKLKKISNLSPGEFKQVVYHFLDGKFIKGGNCSLCSEKYNAKFPRKQRLLVRNHVLQKHRKIVEEDLLKKENLQEFMKETNRCLTSNCAGGAFVRGSAKSPSKKSPSVSRQVQVSCRYCKKKSASFKRMEFMHHHLRIYHPEHYFPKVRKISDLPPGEFKQVVYHFVEKFIENNDCRLCDKRYTVKCPDAHLRSVRTHLLQKHHDLIEEDLMMEENLQEFMKETNKCLISKRGGLVEKEEASHDTLKSLGNPLLAAGPILCRYCKKKFSSSINAILLRHHMKVHHPEHFLPNVRKLSNLNPEVFKTVLYFFLEKFTENDNCSLCTKKYMSKSPKQKRKYVRTHLLQYHHKFLDEELIKPENIKQFMEETITCLSSEAMKILSSEKCTSVTSKAKRSRRRTSFSSKVGVEPVSNPSNCADERRVSLRNRK